MPFGVFSGDPDIINHAKFYVNRLRGFSAAAPPKVPFLMPIRMTLTTVPHYRADFDTKTTKNCSTAVENLLLTGHCMLVPKLKHKTSNDTF